MATYQVKSSSGLSFEVTKEGVLIGRLSYSSWFKFDAVMAIADANYPVEPKGFWGRTIEVRDGERVLLTFGMGWKGEIVLQSYVDEERYIFKQCGVFNGSFILVDRKSTELVVMKPQLKWTEMNYEYQLTTTDTFEASSGKKILLLAALHGANYIMSMAMAARVPGMSM